MREFIVLIHHHIILCSYVCQPSISKIKLHSDLCGKKNMLEIREFTVLFHHQTILCSYVSHLLVKSNYSLTFVVSYMEKHEEFTNTQTSDSPLCMSIATNYLLVIFWSVESLFSHRVIRQTSGFQLVQSSDLLSLDQLQYSSPYHLNS